jgi:hypothetical protein
MWSLDAQIDSQMWSLDAQLFLRKEQLCTQQCALVTRTAGIQTKGNLSVLDYSAWKDSSNCADTAGISKVREPS